MLEYFSSPFGLHFLDSVNWEAYGWYADANGKIQSDWTNPAVKDWLALMNQWYKDKLLDPEMLTQDGDKWRAKILDNKAGTACTYSLNAPQWNDQMKEKYAGAEWRNVQPPKGPAGDGFYSISTGLLVDHQYAITKDCKNPDVVMKWLDYLYASEEGSRLLTWGIEGQDYTMVDGKPHYTDAIIKHEKGSGTALWSRGIIPNLPYILPTEHLPQRFSQYADTVSDMDAIAKFTKPALVFALPKEEESSKYSNIVPNIKTYIQEMVVKFIIGKEPLSKYDEFAQKIKSMGLDDAIAIKQAQYDRGNKK
jgi:putative aldouronate transport system substrate-binding protein